MVPKVSERKNGSTAARSSATHTSLKVLDVHCHREGCSGAENLVVPGKLGEKGRRRRVNGVSLLNRPLTHGRVGETHRELAGGSFGLSNDGPHRRRITGAGFDLLSVGEWQIGGSAATTR